MYLFSKSFSILHIQGVYTVHFKYVLHILEKEDDEQLANEPRIIPSSDVSSVDYEMYRDNSLPSDPELYGPSPMHGNCVPPAYINTQNESFHSSITSRELHENFQNPGNSTYTTIDEYIFTPVKRLVPSSPLNSKSICLYFS
jgi:hypothetical protein